MPGSISLHLQHHRGDRDNSGSYRATACQRIRRAGSASCVGVASGAQPRSGLSGDGAGPKFAYTLTIRLSAGRPP